MSEQQSQKRGLRSEGQKTERARNGYEPIPPTNPVVGAAGDQASAPTDQDHALNLSSKDKATSEAADRE